MRIEINGHNFSNIDGFYDEIEDKFTRNLEFKTGRNLDAFNDILSGGFGVFDVEDTIDLIWLGSNKSKLDLNKKHNSKGKTDFDIIIEIIKDNKHVKLFLK